MNKRVTIKLMISILIILFISNIFCLSLSNAMSNIIKDGKDFLKAGNNIDETINQTAMQDTSNTIYNILLTIAIILAVIIAMIIGIQFMIASADEKAKVKEALIPFVIGCIVVFGSFTIWKIVISIGNEAEGNIITTTDESEGVHESESGRVHGGGRRVFLKQYKNRFLKDI